MSVQHYRSVMCACALIFSIYLATSGFATPSLNDARQSSSQPVSVSTTDTVGTVLNNKLSSPNLVALTQTENGLKVADVTKASKYSNESGAEGTQAPVTLARSGDSMKSVPNIATAQAAVFPIAINASADPAANPAVGGSASFIIIPQDFNGDDGVSTSFQVYHGGTLFTSGVPSGAVVAEYFGYIYNGDTGYGSFTFPTNTSTTAQTYLVKIFARDSYITSEQDLTITVAGAQPIALGASIDTSTLPSIGGGLNVSITPRDPNGVSEITATYAGYQGNNFLWNGNFYDYSGGYTNLVVFNGDTSTGGGGFPANTGSAPIIYTVKVVGTDPCIATEKDFTVTVAGAKPIVLNASLAPTALPAIGGSATMSIKPQDPNGDTGVTATYKVYQDTTLVDSGTFYDPNVGYYSNLDGYVSSGDAATGTSYFPVNTSATAKTYTVKVYVKDSCIATEKDFTVTVAGAKPIVLNASLAPMALPAIGGSATVSIKPQDPNGDTDFLFATYKVYQGTTLVESGTFYDPNNGVNSSGYVSSGDVSTGSSYLPVNTSSAVQTYTIKVYVKDRCVTSEQDFTLTVAGAKPIPLSASLTPQILPSTNGVISIHASATDPNGGSITSLYYKVIDSSGNGSNIVQYFDSNGTATYNLGTNGGNTALTYTVEIIADDQIGEMEKDFTVTQAAFKPIAITASVTPQNPPAANGNITISASATDTNGGTITNLYYYMFSGGASVQSGYFDSNGKVACDLGTNGGSTALIYTVRIFATDQATTTEKDIVVTQAPPVNPADKTLGKPANGEPAVGEPINVATGNVYDEITDYQTAGPNKLCLTRYYNSLSSPSPVPTQMGNNWRTNFDRYLYLVSSTLVVAERANGQRIVFTANGATWTCDSDIDVKLTQSGTTWTLTDSDDTIETYSTLPGSAEAVLKSAKMRGGYYQTFAYNTSNQLVMVSDTYHRVLRFTYRSGLVQTVTTPDGLVLTYNYDASGQSSGVSDRLVSVAYSTIPQTGQNYLYEDPGLPFALTGIIDENNNRFASWSYDSKGRGLTSQFGVGAALTTLIYNDSDGSRTVTNALGQEEVYKFTMLQSIPKVTEIDRLTTRTTAAAKEIFAYDSHGYRASQTDWNGNLTTYVNDALGRPTKIVESAGTSLARTTQISYSGSSHVPTQIIAPQLTSDFVYDANKNLLTKTLTDTTTTTAPYVTRGQKRTWIYTWANALLTSVQNPRADVTALTTFGYDTSGALVTTTNALQQTVQVTKHTPGGLPLTIVDANGVTTMLSYDARQHLTSSSISTTNGVLTTLYAYNPAENLLTVTLPDGPATASSYDTAHRLKSITDLMGQTIAYTLDADGNRTLTTVTNASGAVQYQHADGYDALGRLLTDTGGAGQQTGYAYDGNGNVLAVSDPLNHTQQQSYDALNRPVKTIDPTNGITTTAYDAQNHLSKVVAPNNGQTSYVFDGFGEIIGTSSPDTHNTVYYYDSDGNTIRKIDARGAVVNFAYDALDRVTAASYPADAAGNVTYGYDQPGMGFGIGRLTSVKDAAGTLSRAYDERGNVVTETRSAGAATLSTSYDYDADGHIVFMTYPSGLLVIYVRDYMGRTTSVLLRKPGSLSTQTVVSNIGYKAFGPITSLLFGNGITETRHYDLDFRMSDCTDIGSKTLQNLAYGYDDADNVKSIKDAVTAKNSQSFVYDPLNRMTQAVGGYGTLSYSYDHMSNRLTQSNGTALTTYVYTPSTNQLVSVTSGGTTQNVGYTAAGSINAISSNAISGLTYNQAGRLASVLSGSHSVAQYVYDAFGKRLMKLLPSGTILYQYDHQGHILEEVGANGSAWTDYIYLDNGRPIATYNPATGSVNYIQTDRLGTPQFATSSSQTVTWSAGYQPFGQNGAAGSITQNLRLPGQYADAETGWNQNGFRDYVPGLGRYLESDPLGLGGGLNTYAYARGNPLERVDSLGLFDLSILDKAREDLDKAREHFDKAKDVYDLVSVAKKFTYETTHEGDLNTVIADRQELTKKIIGFIPFLPDSLVDPSAEWLDKHQFGALDHQYNQLQQAQSQLDPLYNQLQKNQPQLNQPASCVNQAGEGAVQ